MDFESYREKYKKHLPHGHINYLLIGESPPNQSGEHPFFFYYDEGDINKVGVLFKNTMMALYERDWSTLDWNVERIPESKRELLEKFSADGFYLIDETDQIIAGLRKKEKRPILKSVKESRSLVRQISELARQNHVSGKTRIAFVSCLGYDVFFEHLQGQRIPIGSEELRMKDLLVDKRMPFPSHGHAQRFRESLQSLENPIQKKSNTPQIL